MAFSTATLEKGGMDPANKKTMIAKGDALSVQGASHRVTSSSLTQANSGSTLFLVAGG
jgi:hypothetical protein